MVAKKANKQYTIDEKQKAFYQTSGFDIYDDKGQLIEYGKGKTVSIEEYEKLKAELEALKGETAGKEDAEKKGTSKKGADTKAGD